MTTTHTKISQDDFDRLNLTPNDKEKIANELNMLLEEALSTSSDTISIEDLKRDMTANPQLYLTEKTVIELGLIQFENTK